MVSTAAAVEHDAAVEPVPVSTVQGRSTRVKVLVVTDEALVHCGFRLLLSARPWADNCLVAKSPRDAVALATQHRPKVAVVDMDFAQDADFDLSRGLREASPEIRLLLLSAIEGISPATVRALGADGFVCRTWTAGQLLHGIRMASLDVLSLPRRVHSPTQLSARQQEILEMIARGDTNGEIAKRLYLSPHTVKQHTSALYKKLKVRNRAEAVRAGQLLGVIVS